MEHGKSLDAKQRQTEKLKERSGRSLGRRGRNLERGTKIRLGMTMKRR